MRAAAGTDCSGRSSQAARTSPSYVTQRLVTSLSEQLGGEFRHLTFECDHMVAETKPAEVAALIRERLR